MHCKVEKIEGDPMSISSDNPYSDELCSVDIALKKHMDQQGRPFSLVSKFVHANC